jgi:hypothetical protein
LPTFPHQKYRWTYQFFDKDLPLIPSVKPKVFAKFEEYSGLSGDALKGAFHRGSIPLVQVVNLPGLLGWTPPTGKEINLDKTFIEELETVLPSNKVPRGRVYGPSELETDILWILELTVLHEMVHFFRSRLNEDAKQNIMSKTGRGHEEAVAKQFEKEAYADRFGVPISQLLAKWMPRTFLAAYGLWPSRD